MRGFLYVFYNFKFSLNAIYTINLVTLHKNILLNIRITSNVSEEIDVKCNKNILKLILF